jgi:uncharacterized membrane protein
VIHTVARLARRLLFRPQLALLLFGSLSLISGWLWFGAGLFLGKGPGLAVWGLSFAATLIAALTLLRRRLQLGGLVLLLLATVVVPTLALIALRWNTGAPILMHDGAYQTEEAMRLLLGGLDPYGVDYTATSMRLWHWYVNTPIDPSLYHYVYPPAVFLLPLPAYALAQWTGVPFDIRLVDLLVEVVAVVAILKLPWRWEWRYLVLAALLLDPFFYLAQGRNDILFLAPIVLGVLAWERDRPLLASLAFGVAAAFKPFAVFFLPLLAVLVWRRSQAERWSTVRRLTVLAGLVLPGLVTIAPFFLWNPGAYWADTVSFVSGSDPHRYPIQGYGFSEILLLLKAIPSPSAYFPFSILQALAALPLFAFGIRRVVRRPTLATVLLWATATLALFLFFSRFVNDNYLAVVLFLAVLAGATRRGARRIGHQVDRDVSTRPAAAA